MDLVCKICTVKPMFITICEKQPPIYNVSPDPCSYTRLLSQWLRKKGQKMTGSTCSSTSKMIGEIQISAFKKTTKLSVYSTVYQTELSQ